MNLSKSYYQKIIYIYIYIYIYGLFYGTSKHHGLSNAKAILAELPYLYYFGLVGSVFANGSADQSQSQVASSLSSCRAASTDITDPFSPLLPIVHRLWQAFRATSRILTELLNVCSSWSSCFCPAICGGSIGVHHLWARPACLVRLAWIVFMMVGGRWP